MVHMRRSLLWVILILFLTIVFLNAAVLVSRPPDDLIRDPQPVIQRPGRTHLEGAAVLGDDDRDDTPDERPKRVQGSKNTIKRLKPGGTPDRARTRRARREAEAQLERERERKEEAARERQLEEDRARLQEQRQRAERRRDQEREAEAGVGAGEGGQRGDFATPPAPEPGRAKTGLKGIDRALHQGVNNTIMIIPVNKAWVDVAVNSYCWLRKSTTRKEIILLGLDGGAVDTLREAGLPVYADEEIKSQSNGMAGWGGKKFNQLVCSKISAVLHLLKRGQRVVLVDADVVAMRDPFEELGGENMDVIWSWGGHTDPTKGQQGARKPPPSCDDPVTEGRCYVNTGYYVARPTPPAIRLFERIEAACASQRPTTLGDRDDQTYANEILLKEMDEAHTADYRSGCFNPCLWTNGKTWFTHRTPSRTNRKAFTVHANFLKGDQKRDKLKGDGLWDTKCVKHFLPNWTP